jgi:5-methylcytosine-specific restriction protein B
MPSTDGNAGGKVEQRIQWPDNLFVIGTVNIDETTHMFSPKVLDRAHVIEFKPDEAQITAGLKASWEKTADTESADELKKESEKGIWTDALSGMLFKENRVMKLRKSVDIFNDKEDDKKVIEKRIMDAWRTLSKTRFSFSHRTAQETGDYIFISHRLLKENADVLGEPPALNDLVDLAFLQKILPKINGSSESLSVKADTKDQNTPAKETTLLDVLISEFRKETELTLCIQKLEEMKATLEKEHFVSFIQ